MLADADRIVSPTSTACTRCSLGHRRLEGPRARRLDEHARPAGAGAGHHHRPHQGLGPARAGRGGVPDRGQVGLHAQGAEGGEAELPGHQRRRVRARHLQGPRDHAARPAQAGRGRADRRLRDARARVLHLHPRRILAGGQPAGAGGASRRTTRATSGRTAAARGTSTTCSSTAARARTSAAKRPRCWSHSRARRASRG